MFTKNSKTGNSRKIFMTMEKKKKSKFVFNNIFTTIVLDSLRAKYDQFV